MADAEQQSVFAAVPLGHVHPWALLPGLCAAGIITNQQAGEIVMAHENIHRQTLLDLRMLVNDTRADGRASVTCDEVDHVLKQRFLTDMPDM